MSHVHQQQKGIALVTAMIVTLAAVAIATGLGTQQQVDMHRAEALQDINTALSILQDMEQTAAATIITDLAASQAYYVKPKTVTLPSPNASIEVDAELSDLQQKLNLNDLYQSGQVRAFTLQRLRHLLESLRQNPRVANAILDWLDKDGQRRDPGGAEDARYSRKTPAYRAANRYFATVRELLLVHGMTPDIYEEITDHVTVLPPGSGININTVDSVLLRAIAPEITGVQIKNVMLRRSAEPFTSPKDLLEMPGVAESDTALDGLTTQSRYFGLVTTIRLEAQTYHFTSHIVSDGIRAEVIARFPEES